MLRLLPLSLLLVGCVKDDDLRILGDDDTDSSQSDDTSADDTSADDTSADDTSADDTSADDTGNGDCDGPEDLAFFPVIQDASGTCTECSGELSFYASIKNICNAELEMVTDDACLWVEFEVELIGESSPLKATAKCDQAETTWLFDKYEQKEELMATGTLEPNNYRLVISYNDPSETDASISFTVTE